MHYGFCMANSESATAVPCRQTALFATTHWSIVLAAKEQDSPQAIAALENLCRTYWYPLYCFIRRLGTGPVDAQDLTQGFFAYLLSRDLVSRADPEIGRFRSFLLGSLKHFLAHEHERANALRRGGGQRPVSLDEFVPEERYLLEPVDNATPEVLFEQRWAQEQLRNALDRLRAEYVSSGKAPLFELLKGYVWGERNDLTLAQIAEQLDSTEEGVKKAVQRVRHRFRECLRTEIAQTVASPDQIDDEVRHLRIALAPLH
jgi:RNA polymerase sigma-70 factor (ECF subfamily)